MAQPVSNRATLTFGIAAATLVVVIAVLAGPSVVECSSSADGLGACLRGKIDGLTGAATTTTAETPAPAGTSATPAEPAAVAETEPAGPALGLVSAQPDG